MRRRLPPATLDKEFEKETHPSTRACTPPVPTELHAILALAYASNRGKGWRAKDLGLANVSSRDQRFKQAMIQDVKELKGYLDAHSKANGAAGLQGARDGKFKRRPKRYNPITMKYLATFAWGVGANYPK